MDKYEFNKLDVEGKIHYFNSELEKGKTVIRIREDLGIGEKGIQKEIKESGYKYNQKLRQYVKDNINVIPAIEDDKDNTFSIHNNFKSDILEMLQMKDDLKQVIKAFKDGYDKEHTSVIEVITTEGIKIDLPSDCNVVRTTVRVNEEVLDRWNDFCDEHSEYSKTNLLSMCMLEYIDKYKMRGK